MKLYCTKCKYRFERDKIPNRCPYCSANGSVRQVELAQDIIDQVTQEMDMIEESKKQRGVRL